MTLAKQILLVLIIVSLTLAGAVSASAQSTVFLKAEDALKLIFQGSKEVYREMRELTPAELAEARQKLGYELPQRQYTFYIGKSDGKIDGYALIDQQVGKVLPITFITRIDPSGYVDQVEIMVYRESRGGEVKQKRFLRQFHRKNLNSELRLQDDVVNITGATLSSRALVTGVKRALVLWSVLYGNDKALPAKAGNQMGD